MTRTQVYLTPQQHRALKREAAREGISMTEVVRRILDLHLRKRGAGKRPSKDLVLSFVGLGASRSKSVSKDNDRALDAALRARSSRSRT